MRRYRSWTRTAASLAAAVLCIALMMRHAPTQAAGRIVEVLTLDERPIDPFDAPASVRATVFVFTRIDCPIANRYVPTLEELRREFEPRGVRFRLVFVDPAESAATIRAHLREYNQQTTAWRDPRHELVGLSGATVTPEVAVYARRDGTSRLLYRGRIDDRYVDFGRVRPQPSTHDLQRVLEAVLAGRPVTPPTTPAVGCVIADLK